MISFQRYVSSDLTHFVGRTLTTQVKKYQLLKRILKSGILKAKPTPHRQREGQYVLDKAPDSPLSSNDAFKGSVVCFCDIPLADLPLHIAKYSQFGIAFRKHFLAERGVVPVMYIPVRGRPALLPFEDYKRGRVSSQAVAFNQFWNRFNRLERSIPQLRKNPKQRQIAEDMEEIFGFLELNILSHLKFFNHKLHDLDSDNLYMEREWRVSRNIQFSLDDVQRIIVPARFGRTLRKDFPEYDREVIFGDG